MAKQKRPKEWPRDETEVSRYIDQLMTALQRDGTKAAVDLGLIRPDQAETIDRHYCKDGKFDRSTLFTDYKHRQGAWLGDAE